MDPYTEDKITIIEGPPPIFELMRTEWTQGLTEGPAMHEVALTRLRTFNGPALVERCHRAWRNRSDIHLEYRSEDGLTQQAPIVAARNMTTDEGDVLILWVRINVDEHEISFSLEEDELLDELEDSDDLMDDGYDLWDDDEDHLLDLPDEDDDDERPADDDDLPNIIF
ncbi:MAG: hypothetical protein Fur0018_05770 [Anaerolineales bacterium]